VLDDSVGNFTKNFSITSWFKINTGAVNVRPAISRRIAMSPDAQYDIYVDGSGYLSIYTGNGTGTNNNVVVNDDQWHFGAVVVNDAASKIYVDGIPDTAFSLGVLPIEATSPNIGAWTSGGTDCASGNMNGTIDEVKIYNRALTAAEIASLYNGTKSYHIELYTTPTLGGLNDTPEPEGSSDGLVGYWKMNTNADDSSDYGNDGTLNEVENATGRWNQAYEFDGEDDYITTNFDRNAYNFTWSTWIYPKGPNHAAQTGLCLIGQYSSSGTPRLFWRPYKNGTNFQLKNSTGGWQSFFSDDNTVPHNKWTHVAVSYENTTFMRKVYINGVLHQNQTLSGGLQISIGATGFGMCEQPNWDFNGTIDEIRVYNRTLSASEVNDLYLSKGLVGHWTFDSEDGSNSLIAPDVSLYNNSGTVTNADITNEGKFKACYDFDGSGDYITIGNDPDFNQSENVTVSFWVKSNINSITSKDIMGKFFQTAAGNWRVLQSGADGGLVRVQLVNTTGATITGRSVNISDGIWHHIAWVYNTTALYTYGDGTLTDTDAYHRGINLTSQPFTIGEYNGFGPWNGSIDEVRYYNRALSPTEIALLYNGTKSNRIQLWTIPG
jgi:hypothetical protein